MSFTWKRPEGRLMTPEDMMRVIVRVADELDMPDKRGACIIAGMTVRQEADFWRPGNKADPCFNANPGAYQHDSMGNDGKSVGPYQQQTSGPPPAPQWGWGGAYGDPEGTRKRMDPYESSKLFMAALKRRPYRAGNATEAGDWAQDVQKSGVPDAYDDDWGYVNDLYNRVVGVPVTPPPPPVRQPYGVPRNANSNGYGGNGFRFPDWVYALGNAFGLLPSTYPGHQDTDRSAEGYYPNPQRLNRGIDWAAPGRPDEVDRMQRFAEYMFSIRDQLDQLIWENPRTGQRLGVAAGKDVSHTSYYDYPGGYDAHRNHVHTRQAFSLPLPGGAVPLPFPQPQQQRPAFEEFNMFTTKARGVRTRPAMNFFLHTEEGNGTAESLARYCQGQNGVSYHYTLRDRKVYNVVDTDYYSWSVLEANVFSINLCFAGSRAGMSREEWLKREGDIEVAAFIAVQDCKKYGMSVEVLVPRHDQRGSEVYAGSPRSGISDHNYVTRELGIGTHTDVGPNFPWDRFIHYVNKFADTSPLPGDDELSEESERLIREMREEIRVLRREWGPDKLGPSRSFLAVDGKPVESPLGFLYNDDGNDWTQVLTWAYLFHVPLAIDVVESVAEHGSYEGSWVASNDFNQWLNEFGQAYCQGLVAFKKSVVRALKGHDGVATSAPVGPFTDAAQVQESLRSAAAAQKRASDAENQALRDELERLKADLARVAAQPAAATLATIEPGDRTTGEVAANVVDSVEEWTEVLLAMDTKQRAAFNTAMQALALPTNGSTE